MLRTRTSKILRLPLLMIVVAALVCISTVQVKSAPKAKFVLSSQDTQLAAKVSEVYTANVFGCTGGNMSPPLQWTGAPAGTKSFVVTLSILTSMAIPRDGGTGSFITCPRALTNFPRALARSIAPFCRPELCRAAPISGNDAYHGPCPDKGEPPHRYTFTVYALSVEKLDVPADPAARWWYRPRRSIC